MLAYNANAMVLQGYVHKFSFAVGFESLGFELQKQRRNNDTVTFLFFSFAAPISILVFETRAFATHVNSAL